MSKYIKKSFSPHIYQDWIHLFRQCSPEQRSELLLAITDFPNHEPEIEISIWDFIKSQLDTQYQSMENKSQQMSTNRNNKKQKSTEVNQSRPKSTEVDQSSQIEIETGIETRIETEIKEKEISNDISKKNPIDFDTPFQAGGQLWELPPQFRKLALTKYTESEIRAFEMTHSCHENPEEVCLNDIKHEPKPKRFVKPTVEEIDKYCRSRGNNIDARKFYDYYESNGWKVGKNPMKSWEAAVRTWERSEYNSNQEFVPVAPKIADMSKFVRAKPLGEEND